MINRPRILLLVLTLAAPPLRAQTPMGPVPVRAGLSAPSASSELRTASGVNLELRLRTASEATSESHWLEGGIAGAVALGLLGLIVTQSVDSDNDSPSSAMTYVRAAAFSVAIGFSIGALLGSQVRK